MQFEDLTKECRSIFSVHGLDAVPLSGVRRRVLSSLQRTSLQLTWARRHLLTCLHLKSWNLVKQKLNIASYHVGKSPRHSKIVFEKSLKRKQVFWYIVCNLFYDLILISSFFQQRVRILPAFQSHWTTCLQHLSWKWVKLNTN